MLEPTDPEANLQPGTTKERPGDRDPAPRRPRVLLFAGHMIDAPGRESPRFPAEKEWLAREAIRESVERELAAGEGVACGYAGGASGGDILFHEVCDGLGIPTRLCLATRPQQYITSSVEKAGAGWVERFRELYKAREGAGLVRVLSDEEEVLDAREHLPVWLRPKEGYGIWERTNLWMLFNALDEARDPDSAEPNLTLIALWDGEAGDGDGGTRDLIDKVKEVGARYTIIGTKELFGL